MTVSKSKPVFLVLGFSYVFFLTTVESHSAEQAVIQPVVGSVVSVSGSVFVRNETDEVSGKRKSLTSAYKLRKGDLINSGSDGSAKLIMTDKTVFDIGPSSAFKVDEFQMKSGDDRKVQVSLDFGQLKTSVNRKLAGNGIFNVKTKTATMGVRGTKFLVKTDVSLDKHHYNKTAQNGDGATAGSTATEAPSSTTVVVMPDPGHKSSVVMGGPSETLSASSVAKAADSGASGSAGRVLLGENMSARSVAATSGGDGRAPASAGIVTGTVSASEMAKVDSASTIQVKPVLNVSGISGSGDNASSRQAIANTIQESGVSSMINSAVQDIGNSKMAVAGVKDSFEQMQDVNTAGLFNQINGTAAPTVSVKFNR